MEVAEFQQPYADARKLFVRRFEPDVPVRAALLVAHGMAEHGGRYTALAAALAENGVVTYVPDLPGHGASATDEERGHLADRNGWTVALAAVASVRERIAREQPDVPLFLFGHSMGAFLAQNYLHAYGAGLAGAILSAATIDMGRLRPVGLNLIRVEALLLGARHPSAIGEMISFRQFNRPFRPARTGFDWLSRDAAEVDRYVNDPWCGHRCSTATWIELLTAGAHLADPQRLRALPKRLPVLIVAGDADPMCGGEKGPRALERAWRDAGMTDLTVKLYPGARHELLHEACRAEVMSDLRAWLLARSAS